MNRWILNPCVVLDLRWNFRLLKSRPHKHRNLHHLYTFFTTTFRMTIALGKNFDINNTFETKLFLYYTILSNTQSTRNQHTINIYFFSIWQKKVKICGMCVLKTITTTTTINNNNSNAFDKNFQTYMLSVTLKACVIYIWINLQILIWQKN